MLLRIKEHDRIIVTNDPVNLIDPWGLRPFFNYMDDSCKKVLDDPCNHSESTVENCRKREKLQEYWDEVFRNRDIDERVQDANEYAEGRVDTLGRGVYIHTQVPGKGEMIGRGFTTATAPLYKK